MAVGNTFGATALSSYGGFWLAFAIVLTPGGFEIEAALTVDGDETMFFNSFGLFLMVSSWHEVVVCSSTVSVNDNSRAGSFSPQFCSSAL